MTRFFRWLKSKLFKPVETPRLPEPEPDPMPQPIPGELDTEDNGNTRSPDWQYIWDNAELDGFRVPLILEKCADILANAERYKKVGQGNQTRHKELKAQGVPEIPWWFIGFLHYRESSLSFEGVLHNGDRIIGNGRVTTHVPKGRGPFSTWEEAAIDALDMKGFYDCKSWSMVDAIARAERFNGFGYRKTGEYSPYICAGTSFHDETGKYVADGKYSASAPEKQLGAIAIWKGLKSLGVEL